MLIELHAKVIPRDSQNPLLEEYTLNYNTNPHKIEGIFLNRGVLESLGRASCKQASQA